MSQILLVDLANKFRSRAHCCEMEFLDRGASSEHKAYLVIALYAEWEEFVRKLVVTSALHRPTTSTGLRIPKAPGIDTIHDFDAKLRKIFRKNPNQKFSISWGMPRQVDKVTSSIAIRNRSTIIAALTSNTSPADDLRLVRNFLAHRNPATAIQMRNAIGVTGTEHLIFWLQSIVKSGTTQFSLWIIDLCDIARACTR